MSNNFVRLRDVMFYLQNYESPIEEKLGSCLSQFGIEFETQKRIGKYKADIFIDTKWRKIVVECDGEEFHKDKERDAIRDEYMRKRDILVLRFTGRQIYRDVQACVIAIIENISEVYSTPRFQEYLEKHLRASSS